MNTTSVKRTSGILLHPTSLPSPYGIGDLGKAAYDIIDFMYTSIQSGRADTWKELLAIYHDELYKRQMILQNNL